MSSVSQTIYFWGVGEGKNQYSTAARWNGFVAYLFCFRLAAISALLTYLCVYRSSPKLLNAMICVDVCGEYF